MLSSTGAASVPDFVNRAALVVVGASETSRPRSLAPLGLTPQATPAARKPFGRPPVSMIRACSGFSIQRELKKPASASRLVAHEIPSPSGSPNIRLRFWTACEDGALPEVVDRAEHDHPPGARVAVDGDPADVRLADFSYSGRRRRELDERLSVVGVDIQLLDVDGIGRSVGGGDVAGDELALVERQQVRRERDRRVRAECGQFLLDLRRVAVARDPVRVDVLVDA